MLNVENEFTEYKRELTDSIKKEVIAFVNTRGGSIYIGVENDGKVVGVDNGDEIMLRIGNMLRDAVHPDVMMFVQIRAEKIEEHTVIHVVVSEGTNKPYYLIKHGLKPSGVFVRQGSAAVQATPEQIRQMIKMTDGDIFEDNISMNQELTFDKVKDVFHKKNLELGRQQMQTLGLFRNDGIFTNVALLVSDQCPFTIKCAVFQGTGQRVFKDRREFQGSLFKQLEKCYEYLDMHNPIAATFHGLYREDSKAYPEGAIREALLNCIVHRDYSYSASTFISIYENRMEFTSIGGLLPGIHKEDILLGLSVCRNKKLADIFYRLELIEAYGTGLLKINDLYAGNLRKPEIIVAPNAFKLILPKINASVALTGVVREYSTHEETILAYLSRHQTITRKDVENLLQISMATAIRLLRTMTQQGLIVRLDNGKRTRYALPR